MQLGIFEGRGLIHKKGTLKMLKEDTDCKCCFSDSLVKKILWRFTDIAARNTNDYYRYFLSQQGNRHTSNVLIMGKIPRKETHNTANCD